MSSERTRISAKQVIEELANEILRRPHCHENELKLNLIETISNRMGWMILFNRLKARHREAHIQKAHWYQD